MTVRRVVIVSTVLIVLLLALQYAWWWSLCSDCGPRELLNPFGLFTP
jgi:hypothetical protein